MIKQPLFAVAAAVMLLVCGGFAIDRWSFLRSAERVTGVVADVRAFDERRGGWSSKSRVRRPYTRFEARIGFVDRDGRNHELTASAGERSQHGMPVSFAKWRVGDAVPVVYSVANPRRAYCAANSDLWKVPIAILLLAACTFVVSVIPMSRHTAD